MQDFIIQAIAAGGYYGMRTFDQDLLEHVRAGRVTRDAAIAFASNAHDFQLLLASAGVDDLAMLRRTEPVS